VTTRRFAWAVWGLTLALAVARPFLFEAAKVDSDVWAYALFGLAIIGKRSRSPRSEAPGCRPHSSGPSSKVASDTT
jgi:hypothetical protein